MMASSKPPTSHNHPTHGNNGRSGMKGLTNGNAAPPETDLDYISRPENYGGSNLQSLQRFFLAREKQQKTQQQSSKKKKRRREEDELFRRYRHILPQDDSFPLSESGDSGEEEDDQDLGGGYAVSSENSSRKKSPQQQIPTSVAVSESPRSRSNSRRISDARNPTPTDGHSSLVGGDDKFGNSTDKFRRFSAKQTASDSDRSSKSDPGVTSVASLKSDTSLTLSSVTLASPGWQGGEGEGGAADSSLSSSGRKAWTRAVEKNRFAALSADVKSKQIRRKFSQAIKAVMSIRKLAAIMIKKSEEPSAMLQTFLVVNDHADNFSENLRNQGLSFDPSYFKANKEISISSEVKNILNLPPASRSQEQIQTAMYGLQSLPSFAEYPLHMQEKLTKVAWYEKVSPKRTIIRQGHYAENFYFILSGQAVVTLTIYDPKTNEPLPRTANFMRKGTSFGELALLHHSRRTATVTSHDTVQLLSIGREDFFDIFMSRQGNDDIPEHIKFVSQLDFMKGWPIERLLEHPEHCLLHFFKRNMVIVNDSRQSDWLYIVKSGSCEVLKQLRGVTAKLGMRKQETAVDERFNLPHSGTSIKGPKVDTGLLRFRPKSHRSLTESSDCSEEDLSTAGRGRGTGKRNTKLPPPSSLHNTSPNGTTSSSSSPTSVNNSKSSKKFSKESYLGKPATGKAHFRSTKLTPSPGQKESPRPQPSSLSPESTPRSGASSGPPRPVFVQVSRLKPRDVFGLEFVRFLDDLGHVQTSVSLVSRGAECIMLSKDFFCKHANEMVKKNLQELIRPYPDEVTFQESLQRKADWDLFKHTLIEDITSLPVR